MTNHIGSGDYMAYALANRAAYLGAGTSLWRLPPAALKRSRTDVGLSDSCKDQDANIMAEAVLLNRTLFQYTGPRELGLLLVQMQWRALAETVAARIACSQRLHQLAVGRAFCSMEGQYPEGALTKYIDELKANDPGLQAHIAEERARERELVKILERIDVYQQLFKPVIEGCGPRIAARLIASIGSASRFSTAAKMVAFCGVHVLPDGKFARKRTGQVANWHNDARQALYLLGDQFNRRPDSVWGQKLRLNKERARARHPFPVVVVKNALGVETAVHELRPGMFEHDKKRGRYTIQTDADPITVTGTLRYGDAHIHNMALWRTLTQFTKWLWREWSRLDRANAAAQTAPVRVA